MSTAIHDIGYRHYEGGRQSRAQTVRALYAHNLRIIFGLGRGAKAKIMPFLLAALLLLPAVADIAIMAFVNEPDAIPLEQYATILQILIAIFLASQAPVLASREIRHHTVPLYFSRPIGPRDFVAAKFAAFASALMLLTSVPVTLIYIGFLLTHKTLVAAAQQGGPGATKVPSVLSYTGDFAGALVGNLLLALVLASIALLIAAVTPRRGFGVAAVIAVYLISNVVVGIVRAVAADQGHLALAQWMNLFTPFALVYGTQTSLLGANASAGEYLPTHAMGPVFLAVCLAVVALCLFALYKRFRKAGV